MCNSVYMYICIYIYIHVYTSMRRFSTISMCTYPNMTISFYIYLYVYIHTLIASKVEWHMSWHAPANTVTCLAKLNVWACAQVVGTYDLEKICSAHDLSILYLYLVCIFLIRVIMYLHGGCLNWGYSKSSYKVRPHS